MVIDDRNSSAWPFLICELYPSVGRIPDFICFCHYDRGLIARLGHTGWLQMRKKSMNSQSVKGVTMIRFLIAAVSILSFGGLLSGCVQGAGGAGDSTANMASISDGKYKRPSDAEIKSMLTPLQYDVTQHEGTERPYSNDYWEQKDEGIYVDIVSGEPLFSSTHKYDSKTGWPSFYRAIDDRFIVEKKDYKMILPRTEIRSAIGDSHLGHVFNDGPRPTGLRYCMNSASLRFIPRAALAEEGYGDYATLFK